MRGRRREILRFAQNDSGILCTLRQTGQGGGVFGGVGTDVGEAGGILRAGELAGVGGGPAAALLEFRDLNYLSVRTAGSHVTGITACNSTCVGKWRMTYSFALSSGLF